MKELKTEELRKLEEWEAKEKAVTLTNGEWSKLTTFLIMTTKYREGEAKAWAELAEEREEDGSIKYKHAASNAEFWREMIAELESIREKIDEV